MPGSVQPATTVQQGPRARANGSADPADISAQKDLELQRKSAWDGMLPEERSSLVPGRRNASRG